MHTVVFGSGTPPSKVALFRSSTLLPYKIADCGEIVNRSRRDCRQLEVGTPVSLTPTNQEMMPLRTA
jgi:hypothetical protein